MTDTAVATVARAPIIILRERLESRHDELKHALPSDIPPERFIRAITTAAQLDTNLQAVSFQSLWLACMKACRDGLLPDGREGAIVPFKSQAQWIPMTYGLIKRFRQSGECRWITADVVRQGETFEHYVDETGEHFRHVPGDDDAKPIVKVYAAALTKDGAFNVTILSMNDINKIKTESRTTREDAPWRKWPNEMMKKTALRRLSKLLPAGREITDEDSPLPSTDSPPLAIRTAHENTVPPFERRPQSAADTLNQFAGHPDAPLSGGTTPSGNAPAEDMGGGGDTLETRAAHGQEASAAIPSDDAIAEAHERGRQAKAGGFARKAVPPEYRTEDRADEMLAWQCGYDDKPMPEGPK